jgi:hypothetical protein
MLKRIPYSIKVIAGIILWLIIFSFGAVFILHLRGYDFPK